MAKTVRRRVAAPSNDSTTTIGIQRIAEVPGQHFLDGYVNRVIDGLTDFDIFDAALANKDNVLLEGPTGSGKTSAVYAYAHARNMPLYSLSSSAGSEPSQFRGRFIPDGNGGFKWQDGPMTDVARHGGILLINEVNFLRDAVASDFMGLLDKRRKVELLDNDGEVIYAPDDFLIVADMNPDYRGTRELNAAFRNRFAIQVVFDYDDKIEAKLVRSKAVRDMAKQFRADIAKGLFETPVSTNMMVEFERVALALNVPFAVRNFITHFPSDDRPAVKQVIDTWMVNIEADIARIAGGGKASKTDAPAADDWQTDGVWDYSDSDSSAFALFSPSDLTGLTAAAKRELAASINVPDSITKGMKVKELTDLLLGNHPYWNE